MTHHHQSSIVSIIYAALISVALVAQPSQGYADAFLEAKTSFNAYRDRAFKLQNQPQNKYLVGEFTSLTQWMNRAERLLRVLRSFDGLVPNGCGDADTRGDHARDLQRTHTHAFAYVCTYIV